MPESSKIPVSWALKNLDSGELIQPQFPLEEVSLSAGGTVAEHGRVGVQDPLIQWVRGKTRTITFETELYATYEEDTIDSLLSSFIALSEKDSTLGRPPLCLFTYGTSIAETVLVESVDPKLGTLLVGGGTRSATLSFVLKRYTPFSQQNIDPTAPAKESFYLVASAAERSYEAIAKRFYGDPLLGDRLRKRHPKEPFLPSVGATVKVPSRAIILQETVEPASHVLSLTNADAVANFQNILDSRNSRSVVVVK